MLKYLFPRLTLFCHLCHRNLKYMGRSKEYYRKLRKEAEKMYVSEGLGNKEIARKLGVSEKSVSGWINDNDGLWKKKRLADSISTDKRNENINEIVNRLAQQKLDLLGQIDKALEAENDELVAELRKQASALDNSVAQWRKQREDMNKTNRIDFSIYIEVMDKIFDAMQAEDPDLYFRSLDFQERHLYNVSKIFG
jgi:transposase|nr:MAG TPA: Protein of unknown function (DUF1804) [Caudoviricetes sp.]